MTSGGYNYHHDVDGPPLEFRFDLVFPLLVIAAYLISLLAILFAISVLIQVSLPALSLALTTRLYVDAAADDVCS